MRFILLVLLAWFLYNLLFKFIIPIYRTTRQMKKKFREMHEHMNGQQSDAHRFDGQPSTPQSSTAPPKEDYIDFEEIK